MLKARLTKKFWVAAIISLADALRKHLIVSFQSRDFSHPISSASLIVRSSATPSRPGCAHAAKFVPDWAIAFENKPFANGATIKKVTLAPPALWPNTVTLGIFTTETLLGKHTGRQHSFSSTTQHTFWNHRQMLQYSLGPISILPLDPSIQNYLGNLLDRNSRIPKDLMNMTEKKWQFHDTHLPASSAPNILYGKTRLLDRR